MKATLVHNPGAGRGEWDKQRLLDLVGSEGFDCDYWSFDDDPLGRQEQFDADAPILIAGGDGAVASVLTGLRDRSRPIGILPTGGSNNLARSLHVFGPVEDIAKLFPRAERKAIGLIRADVGSSVHRIAEAVGVGALSGAMDKDATTRSTAEKRSHGRALARDAIAAAEPIEVAIEIDGTRVGERILFVEALNIPMIGPHLRVGVEPHRDGPDFEVVWLPTRDANEFIRWLEERPEDAPAPLQRRYARSLKLSGVRKVRLDDGLVSCQGQEVVVRRDPPAFVLLAPVLPGRLS